MLSSIIRFSLRQRVLVLAAATLLLILGAWQATQLPIDVFPDLNRPRVTVLTEAHGMAPEEVETLITFPIETALNGANGIQAVRSQSAVGLSVVYAEFDWDTDIYRARQIVSERLAHLSGEGDLPPGIKPGMGPISSIMGQIVVVGMWSEGDKTSAMEVRTLADWVVRPRLLAIPGVARVTVMGGERMQYQVLVDPHALLEYGVTLHEVEQAVAASNVNVTGGYLDEQGPQELQIRGLGRVGQRGRSPIDDLKQLVVKQRHGRSVLLRYVADIQKRATVKRGDSRAYVLEKDGAFSGGDAVTLSIYKQPDADTRHLTAAIEAALADVSGLPDDIQLHSDLYQQRDFIDRAVENVFEALWHGGVLVLIILFLFLLNVRTTFITLTAIPVSIAITAIVFSLLGLSINTMTLGGLAVAIGELVDDAIVDVENIFRRLRENRQAEKPKNPLLVVFQASCEIRSSIVFGTMIVVLVFIPLFALSGMEGRLFTPLGVAYVVSILSSLLVSLTLTPVLSYWLLGKVRFLHRSRDGWLLRSLKAVAGMTIAASLKARPLMLSSATVAVVAAVIALLNLEQNFLPPFNEGSVQINVILGPGTSIARSNEVAHVVDARLRQIEGITAIVSRTGRAEEDEHAMDANITEIVATLDPATGKTRQEIIDEIRLTLNNKEDPEENIPGIVTSTEQPLAHLISHMLTGVAAQVAIKIYGDDLAELRRTAEEVKRAIETVPGVADPMVEPQVTIPQLRIELDRSGLELYGLTPDYVNHFVETAMQGRVLSHVLSGQRKFDILVRLDEPYREDVNNLERLLLSLPDGDSTPLGSVARIYRSGGPNMVGREKVRRRIVVQCNTTGKRGLVDVVDDIKERVRNVDLPTGYFVEYGGQFESQKSAIRVIGLLLAASMVGVFLLLYVLFRSANFALQVMIALPAALIGSVAALWLTGQTLTIAAVVGFVALTGIATRNGILLLNHYLHLVRFEGETWSREMLIRAGKERVAPVLMTALTSGIGLVPLALAAGQPGKEILYPVATVIIGGLITSTLMEFLVRPALFSVAGFKIGEQLTTAEQKEVALVEEEMAAVS